MGIILFSGCSVTKHLPEGEVLYTGGKTVIQNKSTTPVGGTALTEIEAALDKTPSTKMFHTWHLSGSHVQKYDATDRQHGFRKNHFFLP